MGNELTVVDAPDPEVVMRAPADEANEMGGPGALGIKGVPDKEAGDGPKGPAERDAGPGGSETAGGGLTGKVDAGTIISDR